MKQLVRIGSLSPPAEAPARHRSTFFRAPRWIAKGHMVISGAGYYQSDSTTRLSRLQFSRLATDERLREEMGIGHAFTCRAAFPAEGLAEQVAGLYTELVVSHMRERSGWVYRLRRRIEEIPLSLERPSGFLSVPPESVGLSRELSCGKGTLGCGTPRNGQSFSHPSPPTTSRTRS